MKLVRKHASPAGALCLSLFTSVLLFQSDVSANEPAAMASASDTAPKALSPNSAGNRASEKAKQRADARRDRALAAQSDANLATRSPPPPGKELDEQKRALPVVRAQSGSAVGKPEAVNSPQVSVPPPRALDLPPAGAPEKETDEKLRERLQAAVYNDTSLPYSARRVGVRVKNGVITLYGQVNTDYERRRVRRVIDRSRGPHRVKSEIVVRNQAGPNSGAQGPLDPGPAQARKTR